MRETGAALRCVDVIVIGGGIVGCAVLEKLSHFAVDAVLLEKGEDVAVGSTKANSGIVHAGFDAEHGTKKAFFNVKGNEMFPALCKRLKVPYFNLGALVLADKDGAGDLACLIENGRKNGVEGLELLNREEILLIEPNVADNIEYALYAATSGVISPFLTAIALADNAIRNGQQIELNSQVTAIEKNKDGFEVLTSSGVYKTKVIINCAGANAGLINKFAGAEEFKTELRRGDYFLLDSSESAHVKHTCFTLPSAAGKGVLVTLNADGTLLAGPTAVPVESECDTATGADGLRKIKQAVPAMIKSLDFGKAIRTFAGIRNISGHDFIIENSVKVPNFITVGGICSPGLTSAPAIAEFVVEKLMQNTCVKLVEKTTPHIENPEPVVTKNLTFKQWEALAAADKNYSSIVCRCEKITYGEVLDALRSPLKPTSLDAVKRRVRAGMGRCQGGFCSSKLIELICKELDIPKSKIKKCGEGSEIFAEEPYAEN